KLCEAIKQGSAQKNRCLLVAQHILREHILPGMFCRTFLVSANNARSDEEHCRRLRKLHQRRAAMIPIAPHITAFLQQRLPVERRASGTTCDSYAYAFKLRFEYASDCL